MGLVVEAEQRSARIGARLLSEGEAWARQRGARRMVIGTRVEREAAHRFYSREGYRLEKTWRVLAKDL
jgi:GNAT superfamily N-acetyltransferase